MKKALDNFIASMGMFTTLPMPYHPLLSDSSGLLMCYPLVGLVVGFLWHGLFLLLSYLLAPPNISGAVLCVFPLLITGFMHMDGFMDVTDAVMSSRDMKKRLKILKDPSTGAFSVCALSCLLIVQYSACVEIYERNTKSALIFLFLPVFSRCIGALALICPPLLESSSLGRAFGQGLGSGSKLYFILCAIASAVGLWASCRALPPTVAALLALLGLSWAVRSLGGSSGDVSGFCLALCEAAALAAAALTT